jgi:hypothetical protein
MSKPPPSAGKIVGITCGSIFAVLVVLPAIAFSNFGFGTGLLNFLIPAIIVAIILIVRNNKKKKSEFDLSQQHTVVSRAPVQNVVQPSYVAPSEGYPTTVCEHIFSAEDIKGKTTITCPCGYKFNVKDLVQYKEVSDAYLALADEITSVRQRLISSMQKSVGAPTSSSATAPTTSQAAPARVAAPVKPKRVRSPLTLQQWLIMGASAIIVMAGSVFVSANLDTLSSEGFLAVTGVIFLVTGGLAVWGRKFSVMLANFMANFSSAMLMFSILIIGDIFYPFEWDSAPAWWWSFNLVVVAAVSAILSRFTANFGWKIAALASLTASALTLSIGQLAQMFEYGSTSYSWFTTACIFFALLIAMASKWIATFKAKPSQITSELEYEKDLAQREASALEKFTFWTFSALGVLGVGNSVIGMLTAGQAPEPVSYSAAALVAVIALVFKSKWVGALTSDEKAAGRFFTWLQIFAFTYVALSLSAWTRVLVAEDIWGGVIGTAVLMFATVASGFFIKKLSLNPVSIHTAHFALVVAWVLWHSGPTVGLSTTLSSFGLISVSFAASLAYLNWLGASRIGNVFAVVANFIGLLAIALGLRLNADFVTTSVEYAAFGLGLVLLSVLFAPITALIAKKNGAGLQSGVQQTILWLTGALTLFLALPSIPATDGQNFNLAAAMAVSALVTGILSVIGKTNQTELKNLLSKYSYVFQGSTLVTLLVSLSSRADLGVVGTALLVLAGLNYVLAWFSKRPTSVWLAYGFSLAGLLLVADYQRENWLISAHLALIIVVALALNYVLRIVDKRVSGRYNSYFAILSIFGSTIGSLVINNSKWSNIENADQVLLALGLFVLIALLSATLAELKRFNKGKLSMALRVTGLAYLLLAYVSMVQLPLSEELSATYGDLNLVYYRTILVGVVFAAITLRQLKLVSKDGGLVTNGWFALSYLAPVTVALTSSGLLANQLDLGKFELELYTIPLAIALAIPALFNSALAKQAKQVVVFDVPVLFPVVTSLIFATTQDINDSDTLYRLVVSSLLLAAFAQWKLSFIKNIAWNVLSYLGLVGLALSLSQLVEVLAPTLWDGPELFGITLAAALVMGNKNLSKVIEFKSSMFNRGLPLFVLLLPSILETYRTLDTALELTDPIQITRILGVLVIALLSLILGIRAGSLGVAVAGGASLSLLLLPITWVSAGSVTDLDNTIALRGLAVSMFLFLLLGGLRSINKIPDSSYLYLGVPTVVALGPALYLTLSSIGDTTLAQVDWWRFGIVVGTSIVLLVVGALRSLGGLFFPGLVGVVLGVLPYAFQPVARESWFLWVVLLLIAAVMVWIAVRLENIRKLGKSGVSWIKALR